MPHVNGLPSFPLQFLNLVLLNSRLIIHCLHVSMVFFFIAFLIYVDDILIASNDILISSHDLNSVDQLKLLLDTKFKFKDPGQF